jgi:cupin fold WbuC family metalloprotein
MNQPIQGSTVFVNQQSITKHHLSLLVALPFSETGTRRLCFHESDHSLFHVMLVQASIQKAFPRHCHTDSDEFTTVVTGGLEITIWTEGLQSSPSVLTLGSDFSGDHATVIRKGTPHTTRPLTESTVYLEVKLGPFKRNALRKL